MKATIHELVAIRVQLEAIKKPEYTLQSGLNELERKISDWTKTIEIVPEDDLVAPETKPTHDDLPF